MRFMRKIDVNLPLEMPDADKAALRAHEFAHGMELIQQRTLLRIGRIVGRVANFSLSDVPTLKSLHVAIASLPMFPFMKIDVTPVIDHPMTSVVLASHTPSDRTPQ